MPRQISKEGDLFWVPIDDGTFVLGQIVEIQPDVLNSITCAFYDLRANQPHAEIPESPSLISIQFVTKDLFNSGKWVRQCNMKVTVPETELPYRNTAKDGWIGAKVVGSGIMTMFLSAFYGLRTWDEMHDPMYYEKLLKSGIERKISA